ncbi:hypothetical protein, partial [Arthrobacter sp. DR-2P]
EPPHQPANLGPRPLGRRLVTGDARRAADTAAGGRRDSRRYPAARAGTGPTHVGYRPCPPRAARPGSRPRLANGGVHRDVLPRCVVVAGVRHHNGRHHPWRVHGTRTTGVRVRTTGGRVM